MRTASHAPHPVLYRPVTKRVTNGASGTVSGEGGDQALSRGGMASENGRPERQRTLRLVSGRAGQAESKTGRSKKLTRLRTASSSRSNVGQAMTGITLLCRPADGSRRVRQSPLTFAVVVTQFVTHRSKCRVFRTFIQLVARSARSRSATRRPYVIPEQCEQAPAQRNRLQPSPITTKRHYKCSHASQVRTHRSTVQHVDAGLPPAALTVASWCAGTYAAGATLTLTSIG
jgi:hypothetical protein